MPDQPIAFLFSYVRRRPWQFGLLMTLVVAAACCSVGVQYGMKLIVDDMAEGDRGSQTIWQLLTLFIALTATESVLWRLAGWLGCLTVVATGVSVRLDIFKHLSGHPMRYFSTHMSGSLGNRVTATASAVAAVLGSVIWHLVPPCVDFIGAVVVLISIDPRMAVALVVFAGAVGLFINRYGSRGRPLHQAFAEKAALSGGEVVDVVSNIWTIKAFSAREREYRRLQAAFGLEARAQRRSWLYTEKARVLHDICLLAMAGGMLVWAIHSWRIGASSPGDVVVISALTFRILHGSRDLALSAVEASRQMGIMREMLRVVAVPHQVVDKPNAPRFVPGRGAISLQNVVFSYGDTPPVLHDFSLHIPPGQRVGVVGPSGAGKSTLIALIQRLDDVQAGQVSIDGQPVTDVTQESLREAIGVVPQEIALLHRSVMENIRYGRPDATDEEVFAAARDAHCDEFIRALPQGYDTLVGERGMRLSGGQRQRLGIARAFVKNAPILLLDEATSALDSESERDIQRALSRLMRGRTVIAVAHRLSTVAEFDRIVVIVGGRVVEDGPPQRLKHRNGPYARLWNLQVHGFETE